jgi:hypothetical protein
LPFGALFKKFEARQTAITVSNGLPHPALQALIQNKSAPKCHYHLQRAVTPNWMGSIAL